VLYVSADSAAELVGAAREVATAPIVSASTVLLSRPPAKLGGGAALVVRLHGAAAAVDADRRVLERHLGRALEAVPGELRADVLERVRDHAAAADVVLRIRVLPSRLGEALRLLDGLEDPPLAADVHGAEIRVGVEFRAASAQSSEAAQRSREFRILRQGVEELGGSLGLERWPHGVDAADVASTPTASEAELIERVARVFDPGGTLWKPATEGTS
jgi:hypothetical protein